VDPQPSALAPVKSSDGDPMFGIPSPIDTSRLSSISPEVRLPLAHEMQEQMFLAEQSGTESVSVPPKTIPETSPLDKIPKQEDDLGVTGFSSLGISELAHVSTIPTSKWSLVEDRRSLSPLSDLTEIEEVQPNTISAPATSRSRKRRRIDKLTAVSASTSSSGKPPKEVHRADSLRACHHCRSKRLLVRQADRRLVSPRWLTYISV
jgi:hypothetical protein